MVKWAPPGASTTRVDHHPVDQQRLRRHRFDQFVGGDDPLHRQEALLGGHQEQIVEVGVDAGVGGIALRVTEIEMHERGIQVQRRHRDERLVSAVRAPGTGW